MSALKKTLVLPILGEEIAVDVDFRVIEVVERVFDMSADACVALLNDTRRVQRNKIADVVLGWIAFKDIAAKRREIREAIIRANPELLALYVTSIYAALLFALNYYDPDDPKQNAAKFDALVNSAEFPRIRRDGDDGKKKKAGGKKEPSSPSATPSQ